jgi:hypothetical protein
MNLLNILKNLKNNPMQMIARTVMFYRQGASLFNLLLGLVSTTILIGEYILPGVDKKVIFVGLSLPIVIAMVIFGRLDFKFFTYPQTAQESIKNSPPARDSYEFFAVLMKALMDKNIMERSEENKRLLESMEKWYK